MDEMMEVTGTKLILSISVCSPSVRGGYVSPCVPNQPTCTKIDLVQGSQVYSLPERVCTRGRRKDTTRGYRGFIVVRSCYPRRSTATLPHRVIITCPLRNRAMPKLFQLQWGFVSAEVRRIGDG